ncbi:Photosystem II reaction center protein Z [Platanthera zijinensis]|uniref:Photosystem II reaction center protein Z n=1 Tax=Platanthera zijinensis TaxID=2320716 RepID=A0AAP0B0W6_9ASPA
MTIAFQLAVFALIATSLILLISVPVVFASSDDWSSNKNVVFSGTNKMRIWSNGKISLCQGEDAGSIPAIRPWYS